MPVFKNCVAGTVQIIKQKVKRFVVSRVKLFNNPKLRP